MCRPCAAAKRPHPTVSRRWYCFPLKYVLNNTGQARPSMSMSRSWLIKMGRLLSPGFMFLFAHPDRATSNAAMSGIKASAILRGTCRNRMSATDEIERRCVSLPEGEWCFGAVPGSGTVDCGAVRCPPCFTVSPPDFVAVDVLHELSTSPVAAATVSRAASINHGCWEERPGGVPAVCGALSMDTRKRPRVGRNARGHLLDTQTSLAFMRPFPPK